MIWCGDKTIFQGSSPKALVLFFPSKSNLSLDNVIFKKILIIDIILQNINNAFQKFDFSLFEIMYTFIPKRLAWFGVWANLLQPVHLIYPYSMGME